MGFFKKIGDTRAAALEAEELFKGQYPNATPKTRSELNGIFLSYFKKNYDFQKRHLIRELKEPTRLHHDRLSFFDVRVLGIFENKLLGTSGLLQVGHGIIYELATANKIRAHNLKSGGPGLKDEAQILGEAYGKIVAGFEFGLGSGQFLILMTDDEKIRTYQEKLLPWIREIAKKLKELNPNVTKKIIRKRIKKITLCRNNRAKQNFEKVQRRLLIEAINVLEPET